MDPSSPLPPDRTAADSERARLDPAFEERVRNEREKQRQERIVADTNRLVALSTELLDGLERRGTASEEDRKHLIEIERLARAVKTRMKE